ncbi:MAG: hypothetical protein ACOYL5_02220 [Phototrophicaceae bacterium]
MIQLTDRALSPQALAQLQKHQAQVDAKPTWAEKVAEAARMWKPQNRAFDEITEQLIAMCPGTRRCCYCEDARAEDVEHYRPKSRYPEDAYVWENYLYACSACNSNAKRDQFAVIVDGKRQALPAGVEPINGQPALINPRYENPLDFLELDLLRTFEFGVREGLSELDQQRADYTIEVLQLNKRVELVDWRQKSYRVFVGWVDTYARYERAQDLNALQAHYNDLKSYTHLAVWEEMKRTYSTKDPDYWENTLKPTYARIREIDALFRDNDELLTLQLP